MNAFFMRSEHILYTQHTFYIRSEHILYTQETHSIYAGNTYYIRSEHILYTQWTHSLYAVYIFLDIFLYFLTRKHSLYVVNIKNTLLSNDI